MEVEVIFNGVVVGALISLYSGLETIRRIHSGGYSSWNAQYKN